MAIGLSASFCRSEHCIQSFQQGHRASGFTQPKSCITTILLSHKLSSWRGVEEFWIPTVSVDFYHVGFGGLGCRVFFFQLARFLSSGA